MIKRVLLDNDVFLVTQGYLGGLTCTHKPSGNRRKASLSERLFMLKIAGLMVERGVRAGPGSKPFMSLLERFAHAVCEQGPVANVFFRMTTAEDWAYIFSTEPTSQASSPQ